MHNRRTVLAAMVVGVLLLAACRPVATRPAAGDNRAPGDVLAGSAWVLERLEGEELLPDTTVTLRFGTDGSVGGSDGCNSYSGPYTVEGGTIRFASSFGATMMACPEPVMTQAGTFMQALHRAVTFAVEDERLRLLDEGGAEVTRFTAPDDAVTGTSWEVRGYNNGRQAVVSVITGTTITATFGADGRVSGSAGCNHYFATYDAAGETIRIGVPGATRKACAEPHGVMEQEQQYLSALRSAVTFRVDGKKMELRTADGALAVTLVRSDGGS